MRHISTGCRAVLLIGITAAMACGGSATSAPDNNNNNAPPPPPPPPPATTTVKITNNAFSPGDVTIKPGTTVTWNWDTCSGGDAYGYGQTCVDHSVAFDDGSFTSGTQSTGSTSHQFATAGTYTYHCAVHGAAMSGRVIVQ